MFLRVLIPFFSFFPSLLLLTFSDAPSPSSLTLQLPPPPPIISFSLSPIFSGFLLVFRCHLENAVSLNQYSGFWKPSPAHPRAIVLSRCVVVFIRLRTANRRQGVITCEREGSVCVRVCVLCVCTVSVYCVYIYTLWVYCVCVRYPAVGGKTWRWCLSLANRTFTHPPLCTFLSLALSCL